MHQRDVLGEPVRGVPLRPATGVLQRLRQIPVVEGHPWLDAVVEQFVHQALVEVEPGRVAGPVPPGCTRGHPIENRYAVKPRSAISFTSSRNRW